MVKLTVTVTELPDKNTLGTAKTHKTTKLNTFRINRVFLYRCSGIFKKNLQIFYLFIKIISTRNAKLPTLTGDDCHSMFAGRQAGPTFPYFLIQSPTF